MTEILKSWSKRALGIRAFLWAGGGASVCLRLPREDDANPEVTHVKQEDKGDSSATDGKECSFVCGSICFVTKDPIDPERESIRWAYDLKDSLKSNRQGATCYFCHRTWAENPGDGPKSLGRDREAFKATLSRDHGVLKDWLKRRQAVIDRTKAKFNKGGREKRAGV